MKHTYVLLSLVAAATLTACSSGGSTASLGNSGALISQSNHQSTSNLPNQSASNLPSLPSHQLMSPEEMQKQNATLFIDGQKSDANLNFSKLSVGLHNKQFELHKDGELFANGKLRIYRQPNSVVVGTKTATDKFFYFNDIGGNATKTLPTTGTYQYKGHAFTGDSQGDFNYSIDFSSKTGQGSLSLNNKTVNLPNGSIHQAKYLGRGHALPKFNGYIIKGSSLEVDYELGIFGNQAEEVAGYTYLLKSGSNNRPVEKNQIGLIGTKQ